MTLQAGDTLGFVQDNFHGNYYCVRGNFLSTLLFIHLPRNALLVSDAPRGGRVPSLDDCSFPVVPRSAMHDFIECCAEGAFGAVPDRCRNTRNRLITRAQQLTRDLHAPVHEVDHWRDTNLLLEHERESRTRHVSQLRKLIKRAFSPVSSLNGVDHLGE